MEQTLKTEDLFRLQGEAKSLRRLKFLRDEVNGPKPDQNQTKPRSRTNEITLRGRSDKFDETGEITGKKGTRYSEVSTTIPFGTGWITAPTIDENGNKLSDEEVKQRLKDNQGKDFITGEKLKDFLVRKKRSRWSKFDEAIEGGLLLPG